MDDIRLSTCMFGPSAGLGPTRLWLRGILVLEPRDWGNELSSGGIHVPLRLTGPSPWRAMAASRRWSVSTPAAVGFLSGSYRNDSSAARHVRTVAPGRRIAWPVPRLVRMNAACRNAGDTGMLIVSSWCPRRLPSAGDAGCLRFVCELRAALCGEMRAGLTRWRPRRTR
jgi:hypothetical protein